MIDLYDSATLTFIWLEVVSPYFAKQREGMLNVWSEHGINPSFELLDRPECLLVFERADRQRERLRQHWPGPSGWLTRVSEVWGVPLL
jgi:hypothetical protein